jgi:DNA-dependent protein kinase catalytic subunit
LEVIDQIFGYFTDDENVSEIKANAILQYVIPLLQCVSTDTVEQFFVSHIALLGTLVATPPELGCYMTEFYAGKVLRPQICTYSLVELLYSRLPKESLSAVSKIGKAFSSDPGTVMTKVFLNGAINARNDESVVHQNWRNIYMQYQCCALKASISITCCLFPNVAENETKYNMYIFNISKANFWPKIIDCSKDFDLKMDFEELPVRKKKLVCIRRSARVSADSPDVGLNILQASIQYPASQQLFDSTLCEDVSRFDLSHVDLRSHDETVSDAALQAPRLKGEQEEILLELDDINKHECMAIMCALVRHCSNGTKPNANRDVPEWMKNIKKALNSASQHKNVKLFIIKLIMNVEDVFKPYAKFWLDPISLAIIDESLGCSMNYVISDTVSMLLSWHDVTIPRTFSEITLASTLLELLTKFAYHPRRDIARHNLELIKTMVEVWKPILNVRYQLYFDITRLRSNDPKLYIGLQVIAILLANKILPWNEASSQSFIENVLDNHFMDTSRRTNRISAEIIGMILKWSTELAPLESLRINIELFKKKVEHNLKTMHRDKNLFFPSLNIIHKYYNPIVDIFLRNLLYDFLHQIGDFKIMSLEMISSRIETMEDNIREVSQLGLERLMVAQGTGEQEHALKMVAKLLPVMTSKQALQYVICIPSVLAESGPDSRAMAYEVLMQVIRHSREEPEYEKLLNISIGGLMGGLYDPDASLQQKVLDFWTSGDLGFPQSATDRFVALSRKLFVKETAHLFLSNLLQLMLQATVPSPDYNKPIFERGLSDCKFEVSPHD